jgi:putative transposase
MPWQGVSPVDLRLRFITEYLTESYSMTELAAAYHISRKTAYYWVRQYQREGPGRLAGASRRPHQMPRATSPEIVERLVAARQRHPTWGAGKLRDWLMRRAPDTTWPCRDTIHTILTRAGAIRHRRRRRGGIAPPPHLTIPRAPNHVWTVDFKGQFCTGDGVRCYPFTLRDGYSRYILRCAALRSVRTSETQPQFARAFATYGLPERIRSDNGPPFGAASLAGLSTLAVWWLRLGIWPERSRPGRPGDNGAHEQMHAVLTRDTARPPAPTRHAQQQRFTRFVAHRPRISARSSPSRRRSARPACARQSARRAPPRGRTRRCASSRSTRTRACPSAA